MFLTIKQAAQHAHVCISMVRGWIRDRLLTHHRRGSRGRRGKILIDSDDLDQLLASMKVEGRESSPAPLKSVKLKHLHQP